MVKIKEAIVVEGRYDKNTLSQIVDAPILETSGFSVFKDKERLALLRRIAETRGLIVFTDADGAGFVIRNFLKGAIDKKFIKHAYIPDVAGKERRKKTPGKEGKLGVEGMPPDVILEALRRAGATFLDAECIQKSTGITKADLVMLGLSGGQNSEMKRKLLLKELNLPEKLTTNGLLQALNLLYTADELAQIMEKLENSNG